MAIGSIEVVLVILAVMCSTAVHLLTAYLAPPPMKKAMFGGLLAYGFGVCAIIAAIITPPDVISMVILVLPLGFLFLLCAGIFVAVRYKQVTKGE
ncbi:MAG: hypothetical protein OEV87_06095 [Phycisphaerae bacterium]|nr:hypothetical protein [Phycisphaerae bacterium]